MNVSFEVRPSIVAVWFHALFTKPIVKIGDRTYTLRWGENSIDVPNDSNTGFVAYRYKGSDTQELGSANFALQAGGTNRVVAKLGPLNRDSFRIR